MRFIVLILFLPMATMAHFHAGLFYRLGNAGYIGTANVIDAEHACPASISLTNVANAGAAFNFTQQISFVSINSTTNYNTLATNAFSFAFWVNAAPFGAGQTNQNFEVAGRYSGSSEYFQIAGYSSGVSTTNDIRLNLGCWSGTGNQASIASNVLTRSWHHVAWTCTTGAFVNCYIDGVFMYGAQMAVSGPGVPSDSAPVYIGNINLLTTTRQFYGQVADFIQSPRVISSDEVWELYNEQRHP